MIQIHDKNHPQIIAEIGKEEDKCLIRDLSICDKCENYILNPFNSMMECKKNSDYFPINTV